MASPCRAGFKADLPPQTQNLPGSEKGREPAKLEDAEGLAEYAGSGKLQGKSALITGGDLGVGRAVAVLYAREGANISINYLPAEQGNAEETKRLAEGGLTGGGKCLLIPYDLEKRESVHEVVDRHVMEYGGLDILVNNASRKVRCQRLEDIDTDAVESAFILQMMALTKFALPHIPDGGNIINMASVVAIRGTSSLVDYASAKGAAVSFTRSLSKQLAKRGIRVNAVAPNPVHTPLQPASRPGQEMGSQSQLGRFGQPSEIATSFVFLASKDASLYFGQVLHAYPLGD